jgi:DNA-binding NarL/FixJ family response regulator
LSLRRADALLALGRTAEAALTIEHVLGAESLLPKSLGWRAELLRGRIEAALGKRAEASRSYRAARQLLDELASCVDDGELRTTFLNGATSLLPRTRPEAEARALARERFGGLTQRECEVAALVALGQSNRQIAADLFLSERTVAVHVANVLDKLDFTSRTQIAAWAVMSGLLEAFDPARSTSNRN